MNCFIGNQKVDVGVITDERELRKPLSREYIMKKKKIMSPLESREAGEGRESLIP